MDDAFVQGKLKLKERRLKKAKDQINDILHKETLFSLHQSCKEALSKKKQLSTSGIITESRKEMAKLQRNLRSLQERKELLDSRGAILERKIKESFEKIEDQKRELEKIVFELTKKNVEVLL
jgi:hypothetical protein